MEYIYKTPKLLENETSDLCPGCLLGIAIKFVCEAIEELEINNIHLLPLGVACAQNAQGWGEFTMCRPMYGAGSMSAAIKRMHPDKIVLIYQGDCGSSAGLSDTVHTANRGDSVTVISINNLCVDNQKSAFASPSGFSSPVGFGSMNNPALSALTGIPNNAGLKTPEVIAALPGAKFVSRVSVHNPKEAIKAKASIKKGLQMQIENSGYSFIEILCPCHIHLNIDACDICRYTEENLTQKYPLKVLKSSE